MKVDVIIIGAGAAGLMCAIEASKRKRKVLVLEKSNKVGKKILMSGGGRCNFTNLCTSPEKFISNNKHFCKSALSRYSQWDFITMVERHGIKYFEKTLGQLFCQEKASLIVNMLLDECKNNYVTINLNQNIDLNSITKIDSRFSLQCNGKTYLTDSLVIASGGLSIPTLGSSPFGYQLATQFGLRVHTTRAGLVPFTLHADDKQRFGSLTGISVDSLVSCNGRSFRENLLFTHRGLSGPAILQVSSYWSPGDEIAIIFLPELNLHNELLSARSQFPNNCLKTILAKYVAKNLLTIFYPENILAKPLKQFNARELLALSKILQNWSIKPHGTEGYRTAEVTVGGVDCNEISSQSFEATKVPKLFFIGEVLDVTGWLGGYNFQWAWSSGWAAGQVV